MLRVGTRHVDELLANHPAEASAFAVLHFGICKNRDVELFLPQRGGEREGEEDKRRKVKGEEDKRKKGKVKGKGGSPRPAKGTGQQAKERGGKLGKGKCRRRADKALKAWKKKRRGAVEGQLHIIANGES